jgi:hypothetical protein
MDVPIPGFWFNQPEIQTKPNRKTVRLIRRFMIKNGRDGTVLIEGPSIRHPADFACVLNGSLAVHDL